MFVDAVSIITVSILRNLQVILAARLRQFPAVALLGPRQVGKTTLAWTAASAMDRLYLLNDLFLVQGGLQKRKIKWH